MEQLILNHERAPGDIVTMTALVRDIHAAYPGKYSISVKTPSASKDVWANNPHIVPVGPDAKARSVRLSYGDGIRRASRECVHFLTAWHADFTKHTGIPVPLTLPKPDLHLTRQEQDERIVEGRYWIIVSGGKSDFTTKHYIYERHQQVVDSLRGLGIPIVQAGAEDKGHHHPRMDGALDLVGKTTLREFIRLIAQADGVICTITAAMHIAAALERPCVVTAGGREEWWWESTCNYASQFGNIASGKVRVPHRFLHTLGLLDCCRTKGCWRNKVTKDEKDAKSSYCSRPVRAEGNQRVPECMSLITVEKIVESVLSYYYDGTLEPVNETQRAMFQVPTDI